MRERDYPREIEKLSKSQWTPQEVKDEAFNLLKRLNAIEHMSTLWPDVTIFCDKNYAYLVIDR